MAVFTQADLDALDLAIASGGIVSSLSFQDQSVSFRSFDDMLRLRALMAEALGAAASPPTNYRFAATSKGV